MRPFRSAFTIVFGSVEVRSERQLFHRPSDSERFDYLRADPSDFPSGIVHALTLSRITTLNTDHLVTFLAVCRHMNYTHAARDLDISQPAVWRQVRHLETELDVTLFDQIGKALHLTDAGRTLMREGESLLGHLGRMEEAVRAHRQADRGTLRIAAGTTPGYHLLPRVLGPFLRERPQLELQYAIENSATVEDRLLHNELDLGFIGGPVHSDVLESSVWVMDEVRCCAAPDHPLARRDHITPERLIAETCVVREEGSATCELFETWLKDAARPLEQTIAVRGSEAVKSLVVSGVGFSCFSGVGVEAECEAGRLVRLPVVGLDLTRPITMAWHRDKHLTPAMREFIAACRAFAAARSTSSA